MCVHVWYDKDTGYGGNFVGDSCEYVSLMREIFFCRHGNTDGLIRKSLRPRVSILLLH